MLPRCRVFTFILTLKTPCFFRSITGVLQLSLNELEGTIPSEFGRLSRLGK